MARPVHSVGKQSGFAPPTARRRAWRAPIVRWSELPWGRIVSAAVVVLAAGILISRQIDIATVHAQAARMPAGVAFALLAILPLFGFPVSVLHVASGIRFGAALGFALVALSILLHLLASYAIVRAWRSRFERSRWLAQLRKRVPKGAHASVCVFTVLLPGVPYAAINYLLPLLGVPLRTFVLCTLPLHALRSTVTVVFGDQSDQLTGARLAGLAAYALTILGVSWWTFRRLRRRLEGRPPAANDPMPRA